MSKQVRVVRKPGYEDFDGEVLSVLTTPGGDRMAIVVSTGGHIVPVEFQHIEDIESL